MKETLLVVIFIFAVLFFTGEMRVVNKDGIFWFCHASTGWFSSDRYRCPEVK